MIEQYNLSFLNTYSILPIITNSKIEEHGLVLNGTSSYNVGMPILEHPQIQGLKSIILKYLNLYCNKYEIKPLKLINSWFNLANPGSILKAHKHEESIVSGAFYVLTGENTVPLIFPNQLVKPYTGLLVLFSSDLVHYTEPERDQRIVISFNTDYL